MNFYSHRFNLCGSSIMQYLVSEEQTNLLSDLPSSHEQTVSCLEIKIDVDEMDDIMNSGEDRVHFQEEDLKTRLKETKVFPDFNDLKSDNILTPKTREDSYNPSSNTEAPVKEEEVDLKGKYIKAMRNIKDFDFMKCNGCGYLKRGL